MKTYRATERGVPRGATASQQGFTLVELMVVVTIIGILSMIAIPNLNDHLHASKLAKTVKDMDRVAEAWQMKGGLLAQGEWPQTGETVNIAADFPVVLTARELEAVLETDVPEIDGWGNAFEYRVDALPASCLAIVSGNSDGQIDGGDSVVGTMISTSNRITDLIRLDIRWIIRWDPIWRDPIIIPPPGPIIPPDIFG